MKMKLVVFFALLGLLSINGKLPKGAEAIDRPLTWKDFDGKPNNNVSFKAATATITGYEVAGTSDDLSFKVYFFFNTKQSWVSKSFLKTASKKESDHLLKHEQGHYDIARVISWELDLALNSFNFDKNKVRYQIDSIYRHYLNKEKNIQQRYDKETNHSRIHDAQAKWDVVITNALKNKTINL